MQIILSHYTAKRVKVVGIEEPDIVYYVLENTNEVPKITVKEVVPSIKETTISNNRTNKIINWSITKIRI